MATEKYTTLGQSTLNGAYTSGGVSITVTSAASFPTAANFRIRIDNEILKVTAVAGAVFTVVGAQEGTSAANHSDLATVTEVVTALALDAIRADISQSGFLSALPAAEKAGILYLPTDAPVLYRDSGAAMQGWGRLLRMQPIVAADYAWVNQGTASETVTGGVSRLLGQASAGAFISIRKKTAPATPYTVTMALEPYLTTTNFIACGMAWRQSSDGKIITWQLNVSGGVYVIAGSKYTNETTFSASYTTTAITVPLGGGYGRLFWMRITDDGTNRITAISFDGVFFTTLHTVGRTDFLTADEVGYFVNSNNSSTVPDMRVYSWIEA